MTRVRDFNAAALDTHVSPRLQVLWKTGTFFETRVWQFLIFFPRWLVTTEGQERICTDEDQKSLEELLQRDFGGYTSGPTDILGVGIVVQYSNRTFIGKSLFSLRAGEGRNVTSKHCAKNSKSAVARRPF